MKQKIEFQQLEPKTRKVLLKALGINIFRMKCKYCETDVDYYNCSIFPGKEKGNVIITCNSELCISEWMTEMRD